MSYDYIEFDGESYCNVFVDKTTTYGILRITKEISVNFKLDKECNEWKFNGAWMISVSDREWKANEGDDFASEFPDLYEEMLKGLS